MHHVPRLLLRRKKIVDLIGDDKNSVGTITTQGMRSDADRSVSEYLAGLYNYRRYNYRRYNSHWCWRRGGAERS